MHQTLSCAWWIRNCDLHWKICCCLFWWCFSHNRPILQGGCVSAWYSSNNYFKLRCEVHESLLENFIECHSLSI